MIEPVAAVAFVWLGMVLALSFLEAPLKFRAPGVTLRLGLGIGRLVFAALNRIEVLLAAAIAAGLVIGPRPPPVVASALAAGALLAVQLLAVRPALSRRTDRVIGAEDDADGPGSRAHLVYVALEIAKVVALLVLGSTALAAS